MAASRMRSVSSKLVSTLCKDPLSPYTSSSRASGLILSDGLLSDVDFSSWNTRSDLHRGAFVSVREISSCRSATVCETFRSKTVCANTSLSAKFTGNLINLGQYTSLGLQSRTLGSFEVGFGDQMCNVVNFSVHAETRKASTYSIYGDHKASKSNNNRPGLLFLVDTDSPLTFTSPRRSLMTKASAPGTAQSIVDVETKTTVVEDKEKDGGRIQKTIDDFQHEEIVGPTVDRDTSAVADELRDSLEKLKNCIIRFRKGLIVLGSVQGLGAFWSYISWHSLNPTWQLAPSVLMSFLMAFILRQALQPMAFFGKLEERSRLRIITLSLMISKGFASFFNRAHILVVASAGSVILGLLYTTSAFMLAFLGIR